MAKTRDYDTWLDKVDKRIDDLVGLDYVAPYAFEAYALYNLGWTPRQAATRLLARDGFRVIPTKKEMQKTH